MTKRSRRFLWIGAIGVAALLGAWWMTRPEPLPPLPDPNGYEELVALGQRIQAPREFSPDLEVDILRATVEANREVLDATRDALELPSRVPAIDDQAMLQTLLDQSSQLRTLARLLAAEAKVAEHDRRWDDAAAAYVEMVRLGHACTRGAPMVMMLVGIAIETMGHDGLLRLAPELDSSAAQQMTAELVELEQRRESFDEVLAVERRWGRVAFPWHQRMMLSLSGQRQALLQPAIDAGLAAHRRARAMSRLAVLKIAIHQFEQREGRLPKTLKEVVVVDFPNVAIDPFTDKPLIYRPDEETYQLYSVGPNQKDDAGEGYDADATVQTTDDLSAQVEE